MSSLFVALADVPAGGTADFDAYERAVLPRLPAHGGHLLERLRHVADDGRWREVHLLAFDDEAALAAFRADPVRVAAASLLERSGARVELLPVVRCDGGDAQRRGSSLV